MELLELTLADKDRYNHFVAQAPGGSFLQAWEWGDWQQALGNKPRRFCFLDEHGTWLAAWQSLSMPLPFGKNYVYIPYGPVSGPKFSAKDLTGLLQKFQKQVSEAMFIRVEPQTQWSELKSIGKKTLNIQPAITMVVNLDASPEVVLAAMHPKTRYNIKVAERSQVSVEHELVITPGYGLYAREVVELIANTQSRQHYRGHSRSYYKKLIDFFALQNSSSDVKMFLYRALYQRSLLACAIMVDFGKTRMYLYGGSSSANRNVMAPYALHWQAMLDAKTCGLTWYDLGGSEVAGGGERGFTRFKRGFGGSVVEYAGAYDVYWKKLWYHSYKTLRRANRSWLYIKDLSHRFKLTNKDE